MINRLSVFFVISLLFVVGCNSEEHPENQQSVNRGALINSSAGPASAATKVASLSIPVKHSPIEVAHAEYLQAYDEYVRLLRQSGPQTRKTLHALAEYQKKYRIYQMLLEAED